MQHPEKAQENKKTRQALINCTNMQLMKVGKFFIWSFQDGKLSVQIDQEKIFAEEKWDWRAKAVYLRQNC